MHSHYRGRHAKIFGWAQWRRNEFESGGHRSGTKVGAPIRRRAGKKFGSAPPLFGYKSTIVLVSAFVMVSTV